MNPKLTDVYKKSADKALDWLLLQLKPDGSYGSAKEGKYTAFAEKIVDHLLGIQDADGAWLKNEPAHTSFDQTAEIAIWLREIISESQAI
jgi:hypothetical protein